MQSKNKWKFLSALVLIAATAGGVVQYTVSGSQAADGEAAAAQAAPAATPVGVLTVQSESIRLWSSFSGRLEAVEEVELRPQVSGTIVEVNFEDGQRVKAGDVLFVIDPRTYRTAVRQAKAELDAARQNLALAKKEKKRAEELVERGNVSKRVFDERLNTFTVASSNVRSAIASLEQAEIELDHAFVKSPINGRVSRVEITKGNFVSGGGNSPVLTTIVSTDSIYADFEVDEQRYLSFLQASTKARGAEMQVPVQLSITGQDAIDGYVHSFDNRIDPNTGTIRTRAVFGNQQGNLLPGMYAKLRLGNPERKDLILLPSKAISTDQDRKFVYTVSDKNIVEYRQVTLGASQNGKRVVTSGLSADDQVIVEGIMKVRPGMPVAPRPVQDTVS